VAWSWWQPVPPGSERSVAVDGVPLATLHATSPYFAPAPGEAAAERTYRLSRFAYTRAEAGESLLESPRAHCRVTLHDHRAAAAAHVLAAGCRGAEIAERVPGLTPAAGLELLSLLLAAGMALETESDGLGDEDRSAALRTWEFHDLLFHARSRAGRHGRATGGTYRFLGVLDPPPILKPADGLPDIELPRPDLARLEREDPPFAAVQEGRRSIRDYGPPLTAAQLGEFLYRVGRVADYWDGEVQGPHGPVPVPTAPRPYPSGGGLYELELYPLVQHCNGIAPGLYHYDPEHHGLRSVAISAENLRALLGDAGHSTGIPVENLQIAILITARFQRLAWKYASIAYSIILKDAGVLYQTMYLAATAMGLAPCGVGGGNSDLFARATGSDYYAETTVGEFLLGSRAE
jgi:SagB-type dehydrogenase family enzyme